MLVKKIKPVHVEVIDGCLLSSCDIIYEIVPLDVVIKDHNSVVIFNVLRSPLNRDILGLSWLKKYNSQIDWIFHNLNFPSSLFQNLNNQEEIHKSNVSKPLLEGARAFMYAAKEGSSFAIYATPISDSEKTSSSILSQYQEFQDIFEKKNADILLKHRPYDCSIDLQEGAQPPFGPIYNLLQNKLIALKKYIVENLAKSFIRHSKSPSGVPILFVKKKN